MVELGGLLAGKMIFYDILIKPNNVGKNIF